MYKQKRNEHSKMIKQKKCEFNRNQIKLAANDQKRMWNCLRNMVTKKNNNQVNSEIIFENSAVIGDDKICGKFNAFFVNSIVEINSQIPKIKLTTPKLNSAQATTRNNFKFAEIDMKTVCDIAKKLSKKTNKTEYLNASVWYDSTEYVGYHLTKLINQSLKEGCIPECWKVSTIIPIPKIKNTKNAQEFRPINTMPTDEKIIETIVKNQLSQYIEENKLLNDFQSAFRCGHSCETALNNVIHEWSKEIEYGKYVMVVFLDLKRAFETVDRSRMIEKLQKKWN